MGCTDMVMPERRDITVSKMCAISEPGAHSRLGVRNIRISIAGFKLVNEFLHCKVVNELQHLWSLPKGPLVEYALEWVRDRQTVQIKKDENLGS
jgi:hypothetical protein